MVVWADAPGAARPHAARTGAARRMPRGARDRGSPIRLPMVRDLRRPVEDVAPSAIRAIGLAALSDRQIDQRMAERPAAAVASHGRGFHMNDLGGLHRGTLDYAGIGGFAVR